MTPETHDGPSDGTTINGEPHNPKRRFIRENWYRDVWLIIITALLAGALLSFENEQDKGNRERHDLEVITAKLSHTTKQLCSVVINAHEGNIIQLQSAENRLTQTRNYLNTLTPEEEGSALSQRVRDNLPNVVTDVQVAKKQEVATRVPNECVEPPLPRR